MAKKLWRVSRIVGTTPFDQKLIELNEAQLDFILEMEAIDNPATMKFIRGSEAAAPTAAEVNAAWERVLIGKAKDRFMGRFLKAKPMEVLRSWMNRNRLASRFNAQVRRPDADH